MGHQAGLANTSGYGNIYIGTGAGMYNNGSQNLILGVQAYQRTNLNSGVLIGYGAGTGSDNLTGFVGIAGTVDVSYGIVLGSSYHNVGIRQNSPAYPLHIQNAYCDGNTWFNSSDENIKENFTSLNNENILAKVMELKIQKWNYKGERGAAHIGPTAQNFSKVFNLGGNDKAIASVDEVGVALAAIQELNHKTEKLEQLLKEQQQVIASLLQSKPENSETINQFENGLKLYQNSPNPFQRDTKITMEIPQEVNLATLYIYDLQGKTIEKQIITGRGATSVTVEGGRLSSGIYLYTLIGDGKATEVKRMILTD
jgi:hypothetical protein